MRLAEECADVTGHKCGSLRNTRCPDDQRQISLVNLERGSRGS